MAKQDRQIVNYEKINTRNASGVQPGIFEWSQRSSRNALGDIDGFFPPKYLSGENTNYTDYFNITGKYNPALEKITFAKLWVAVSDDQIWPDSDERVKVDLADKSFLGPHNVSLNLLSGVISGDAFDVLNTTGKLKYAVRRVEGDFLFWGAKLLVETCPKSVPDGGATLMLLGAALAGIESLRRRTTRRNLQ